MIEERESNERINSKDIMIDIEDEDANVNEDNTYCSIILNE